MGRRIYVLFGAARAELGHGTSPYQSLIKVWLEEKLSV
jgi:hypothetical protein